MKFTIMGFSQPKVIELNKSIEYKITIEDLAIIRWIVDFSPSMSKYIDGENIYYWLEYKHFLEDMPIIDITKDRLYRRLLKLVSIGILTHKTIYNKGTYSYYGFGEKYKELVSEGTVKTTEGYGENNVGGTVKTTEQNNPSTNNPSTKDNIVSSVSEVIQLFNSLTGKKYRADKDSSNYNFIKARLDDGYLVEDLKRVVEYKFKEWKDDVKMKKYLRPETLFNKTKFESYVNELPVVQEAKPLTQEELNLKKIKEEWKKHEEEQDRLRNNGNNI